LLSTPLATPEPCCEFASGQLPPFYNNGMRMQNKGNPMVKAGKIKVKFSIFSLCLTLGGMKFRNI
jgi:hypothetical protein